MSMTYPLKSQFSGAASQSAASILKAQFRLSVERTTAARDDPPSWSGFLPTSDLVGR
jgi:hypothetical protein